jgi:rhamnogalacturonan endolyase
VKKTSRSNHRFSTKIQNPIVFCLLAWLWAASPARANIPGGGTGTGPNVTVVNNGNGTVTLANGLVSILCNTGSATLTEINYTYNNTGTTVTNQLLTGGKDGGEFYWETGGFGSGSFTYSLVADTGNYCEIDLLSTSATNGLMDVHFSMLRGSPGFYVTGIWSHRSGDGAMGTGEERDNIYVNPEFTWNSVDAAHDFQYNLGGAGGGDGTAGAIAVSGAPQEVTLWTNGLSMGRYEDKYKYCALWGTERVWGWSSVNNPAANFTGQNIGIWHVLASAEYYNGGPMKPELMDAPMVNMINGGHYYLGGDSGYGANEVWTRVSGPYFIYCNNVTNTLTGAAQTAAALFADAQAQAAAEQTAWPYSWFTNANYTPASNRGAVSGQMVIADSGNPNATASNLWVGVVQQPVTTDGVYDFQQWEKPYQFWVRSDAQGRFSIPNVIAGSNYTLYAFGPGAAGTFMSQNQAGANPPLVYNLPATPFAVAVTGGATNSLGTITWTPTRMGPTVFEIGYPSRRADKFRHSEDYWVGDLGPSATEPSPIWSKWLEYPFDFPNGPNYVVGQSRWTTDWNFAQPVVRDDLGNYDASASTITFTLAAAPATNAQACLYLGLASDYSGPVIITVNNNNLGGLGSVTTSPPINEATTGYFPVYDISDTTIREGINGAFSDERLTFPASLLVAGPNTITIGLRSRDYFADHFMYDYLRLELTGYVPPPPAGVTAFAGNHCNLICWPVTPGATSYNVFSSTNPGSGFALVASGVTGPVCGSGLNNAAFVDTNAANGTTCYYTVQSVNPAGGSTNSPASAGATPSAGLPAAAPAAPAGLSVAAVGHQSVTLNWTASPGADFYTVWRSTLFNDLGGASNVLNTIVLNNTNTGASYTDTSPTDGSIYSYSVTATSAGGTSGASAPAVAVPVPAPPATPPASFKLSDTITGTSQTAYLTWSPVPGAVGYILYRCLNSTGPFSFPTNFIQSITLTNWTDSGLAVNAFYSYEVVAMNAGGVSAGSAIVSTPPAAPASLNAYPGDTQITLAWSASAGAANYTLLRGASSGNETTTVATTTNTAYTDTGLLNGTNYYYIVIATGASGTSLPSPEASTAPFAGPPAIYWVDSVTTAAQSWNVTNNWGTVTMVGLPFPNAPEAAAIVNAPIAAAQTVNLNQSITVGNLSLGASGGAFTLAGNGGALTLDNTPGAPMLLELAQSKGDTISAPVILNGTLTVTNASANAITLSGAISGTNGLLLTGPGPVVLAGTNSYSGITTVGAGTLQLNSVLAASSSPIELTGGSTLYENGVSIANVVTNSGVNTWTAYGSGTYYPAVVLTGGGQLNLNITGSGTFSPGGDWSQFSGTLAWAAGNGAACRMYGTLGSANASWDLGASTGNIYNRNGGATISFGALTGGPGTAITGASASTALTTYAVGALNQDSTFNGRFGNGEGAAALSKVGTGVLTLTGTNNNYSGGTTVNAGTLLVNNPSGTGAGTGTVTVSAGGILGGAGIITGPVLVGAGGGLVPGGLSGPLTISNNLTLAPGGTVFFQVQHSPLVNNAATVSGLLTEGGVLNVTNTGGTALAVGDSFKLFNAGSFAGAFASLVLPALPSGLGWNTNNFATNGTLSVGVAPPPPTGLSATPGNMQATLSWPAVAGAVSYLIERGANSGNETTLVASGFAGTNYTDTGLVNGLTYYYVVAATGFYGTGANSSEVSVVPVGPTLTWTGAFSSSWNDTTYNWFSAGTYAFYGDGDNVVFNDYNYDSTVIIAGNVAPGSVTFANSTTTYTLSAASGGVTGPGGLVKTNAGTASLDNANTYTGGTLVSGGALLVNNPAGSGTGAAAVTVTGGLLGGTGIITGPVLVAAGGFLAPGNPLGTLTISNNLTLAAGGSAFFQIQHSPLTNSAVLVSGLLTEGGVLEVTNSGGTALALGDSFQLYNAGTCTGAFAGLVLPALPPGLGWSTNTLNTSGLLTVVIGHPVIGSASVSQGALVLQGGAGAAGASFYLLGSTNLTTPMTNWTRLLTNQFDGGGNFDFTNRLATNTPVSFFRLQVP